MIELTHYILIGIIIYKGQALMKKSLSLSEIFEEESYKSSYHKKHKQMMISYLIESWDLEVDLAWMIIELH